MEMEGTEEVVGSTNSSSHVAKGKRTKRHRPSSSSSADDHVSFNSSTTQEEQDMANCLILLAQGASDPPPPTKLNNALPFVDVYECKTCNRTFPSFQALGGHRASHKKPKLDDKKPQSPSPPPPQLASFGLQDAGEAQFKITPPISLQLPTHNITKPKIHECSICGSEFTSGQALGGHMRRHRASTTTNAAAVAVEVKPRNVLELDLNLPAPEDDLRDSKFQFTPTHKSMVLSAPALVDCHY